MSKEVELRELEQASSKRIPSQPQRHHSEETASKTQDPGVRSNSTPHVRHDSEKRHITLQKQNSNERRTSTQMTRRGGPRSSVEFDRRTDGPFGRPSITMVRRESQQHEDVPEETLPPPPDLPVLPVLPTTVDSHGEHVQADATPVVVPFQAEPPSLDYDLWSRKWWIVGFWTLVVFDSVVCPVALYFGLWYGLYLNGRMSANTVFSIVTAAVGGMSIFEYFVRLWKLVNKKSTCRVMDAKWWHCDFFHWNFTLGWLVIMVELIVGTVQEHPPPRLIAMVVPTMLYVFAVELLVLDGLRLFEKPAPIRLSSIPKGAQVRPGIYTMIEDVVAVDGSGGTAYREKLNVRYEASHVFRAMLRRLGLFWSIGSMAMAVICTILIFTIQVDAAYTIGWTLPFVWAGIWTIMTIWYVKRKLREEKIAWSAAIEEKAAVAV